MASALIIDRGRNEQVAYLAVEVQEVWGRAEYRGEVPLAALAGQTRNQIRNTLIDACQAVRNSVLAEIQLREQIDAIPPIDFTGTINV